MENNTKEILEDDILNDNCDIKNETLKNDDQPTSESESISIIEANDINKSEIDEHLEPSTDELSNLHELTEINEISDNDNNKASDDVINQFAQNLIDPIVKEAIEMQITEMEESISDEVKVDSSGDKKSEKSLSDDGFEYLKPDDLHSPTVSDQNNIESQHFLESPNKSIGEVFSNDDMKLEDTLYDKEIFNRDNDEVFSKEDFKEEYNNSILNTLESLDSIPIVGEHVPISILPEKVEFEQSFEDTKEEVEIVHLDNPEIDDINPPLVELSRNVEVKEIDTCENHFCQKFKEIITWKNPILSLVVLSAIMVVELGLMCDYSIITLLAYSGLLLLFFSFLYKFSVKFNLIKSCGQSKGCISISGEDIRSGVEIVMKWAEFMYNEIRSLTYVVSVTKNLKAFTFFWILTYIGQWFNLLSLIFMGTILLFTTPIVYLTYKETIDQIISKASSQVKESFKRCKTKVLQLVGCRG